MYRDLGVVLARGVSLDELFNKFLGNADDSTKGRDLSNLFAWKRHRIMSSAAPIASHVPVCVGFGMAARMKNEKIVTVSYFGDGATSSGEFHVGLNFAGVYKAPCIFICENNQYAISVPLKMQTASKDIATKALAYGIRGNKVDGNDLLAVYLAVSEAKERALGGGGPTLIECVTYRLGSHSTADDAKRYREEKELLEWQQKDPIKRFRTYLDGKDLWDDEKESALRNEIDNEISLAFRRAESIQSPSDETLLMDVYAEIPSDLRQYFSDQRGSYGN
jgi:2-oxoisovalerate dehydrogenase E1 component alpha subunit